MSGGHSSPCWAQISRNRASFWGSGSVDLPTVSRYRSTNAWLRTPSRPFLQSRTMESCTSPETRMNSSGRQTDPMPALKSLNSPSTGSWKACAAPLACRRDLAARRRELCGDRGDESKLASYSTIFRLSRTELEDRGTQPQPLWIDLLVVTGHPVKYLWARLKTC